MHSWQHSWHTLEGDFKKHSGPHKHKILVMITKDRSIHSSETTWSHNLVYITAILFLRILSTWDCSCLSNDCNRQYETRAPFLQGCNNNLQREICNSDFIGKINREEAKRTSEDQTRCRNWGYWQILFRHSTCWSQDVFTYPRLGM